MGSTWILVLTLVGNTYSNTASAAITSVPGFKDQRACMAAANAWLADVARVVESHRMSQRILSAVCIEQK